MNHPNPTTPASPKHFSMSGRDLKHFPDEECVFEPRTPISEWQFDEPLPYHLFSEDHAIDIYRTDRVEIVERSIVRTSYGYEETTTTHVYFGPVRIASAIPDFGVFG
jgi:hypothetical protein